MRSERSTQATRRAFLGLGVAAGAAATLGASPAGAAATLARPPATDAAQLAGTAPSVITASSYGFDPEDSTSSLQAALDSGADVVVFDNVGADWVTRPLFVNRDAFTLVVEPGVTVRAKPGGYPGAGDRLMSIINRAGVTISGYGATFAMNKPEYTTGQQRAGMFLINSESIVIEGLTVRDAGGDGIYIGNGPSYPSATPYCRDIVVRDVTCDNNRRNSMSVTSVDGLVVTGSRFINANGTNPQVGLDFEPSAVYHRLANIEVRDSSLVGNQRFELAVQLKHLDATSHPVSMILERLYFGPHHSNAPSVEVLGNVASDPGGTVEIRDSLSHTTSSSGSLGIFNRRADGATLVLTRTVWWNVGNPFDQHWPIQISAWEAPPPPATGAADWVDASVITDAEVPVIEASPMAAGTVAANLHGNLTIADPHGVTTDLGPSPQDVDLQITALGGAPATSVSVRAITPSVAAGDDGELEFSRVSADLSAPLAILYETSGSAVEREDYSGLPGAVVIPPNAESVIVPIHTLTRCGLEHARVATVRIAEGIGYVVGPRSEASIAIRPSGARITGLIR